MDPSDDSGQTAAVTVVASATGQVQFVAASQSRLEPETQTQQTPASHAERQTQSVHAPRIHRARLPEPLDSDDNTNEGNERDTGNGDADGSGDPDAAANSADASPSSVSSSGQDMMDPAIATLIPFADLPPRPVQACTTFWGNPIIQSVFKFDGVFFGMVAGMAFRYPSSSINSILHGSRSVKCRIEQRNREFFEREISDRMSECMTEGDQTLYYLRLKEKESIAKVPVVLRLLVSFAAPTRFPCAAWHVTSLELLEIDRTGVNICPCISARRERQAVPFGQVVSDWQAHQYDFLSAPSGMARPRVWKLRHERWRSLLMTEYFNKNRKWTYLDPSKVDDDWTCGICLERPGAFCTFLMKLPCGHTFHSKCFCNVAPANPECPAEIKCPMCRRSNSIIEL